MTQLVFGETYDIIHIEGRWANIRNDADGQTGWADAKMITELSADEEKSYLAAREASPVRVAIPMAMVLSRNNGVTLPLVAGTVLPDYKEENGVGVFSVLGVPFAVDRQMVRTEPLKMERATLEQTLRFFLNAPYLWGGKSVLGMDCSGLTQTVMSLFGVRLLRNASEQATQGRQVKRYQAGDLAFFDHGDGRVTHVGILLDKDTIVHCSGRVKVERFTKEGIVSSEANPLYKQGEITHHLHSVRRYL